MSSDTRSGQANVKEQSVAQVIEDKDMFPKKVGIVFIEHLERRKSISRSIHRAFGAEGLDFDQLACAHFVLQMNTTQSTFEFQIVMPELIEGFSFEPLPRKNHNNKNQDDKTGNSPMFDWFDNQVKEIFEYKIKKTLEGTEEWYQNLSKQDLFSIDYWIGITSEHIIHDWSFEGRPKDQTKSGKFIGIITSVNWEKAHSPPSLFEYIALSILICSLYFINKDFGGHSLFHSILITKGCIFDFTDFKPHRRIDVSNPHLCDTCKRTFRELETKLKKDFDIPASRIHIYDDIHRILSRKWMGDPEKRDSPLYNLNKNYKYNVDRHSGFYKNWWENFRDSIEEKSAEWIVGGIATAVFAVLVAYISARYGFK
jgi:hypothetical protein